MKIPRFRVVDRSEYLVQQSLGKRVLHLGCTGAPLTQERIENHTHLHLAILSTAKEVYGIDIDEPGLALLENAGVKNLFYGDVYRLNELNLPVTFDLILAGELIEHLDNPGIFLECLREFMAPTTEVILTTPNAYSIRQFIWALFRRDQQDPTHISIYSYTTLYQLVNRHHLRVKDTKIGYVTHLTKSSRVFSPLVYILAILFPQYGDSLIFTVGK